MGIRPDSPGFETVLIEPKPGHLDYVDAAMPHPLGKIEVELRVNGDEMDAMIILPEGLSGRFVWMGQEVELESGIQVFTIN